MAVGSVPNVTSNSVGYGVQNAWCCVARLAGYICVSLQEKCKKIKVCKETKQTPAIYKFDTKRKR